MEYFYRKPKGLVAPSNRPDPVRETTVEEDNKYAAYGKIVCRNYHVHYSHSKYSGDLYHIFAYFSHCNTEWKLGYDT